MKSGPGTDAVVYVSLKYKSFVLNWLPPPVTAIPNAMLTVTSPASSDISYNNGSHRSQALFPVAGASSQVLEEPSRGLDRPSAPLL